MSQVKQRRNGLLAYQLHKYLKAMTFVKERRRAIDIGAHVGLWSFQMVHDFRQVEAFEPMPVHRECWEKNMAAFDVRALVLQPFDLGAKPGTVHISNG